MSHKIAITVQAIDQATATLKSVSGEVGNLGDKADSTSRDLQPLGTGLAAIGAAGAAVIGVAAMTAARVEVLGTVLYTVGDNAGYTKEQLDAFEASLTASGITVGASRQGLVQMMQASLDLADATGLARLAQDAAVIANKNSSEAYTDLITVIQTGRSVMAKSLGLTVDFQGAYKRMADQLGKSTKELTEAEKMQARLNEVMAAGEEISGVYEAAMGDVGKKLGSLKGDFEDAANALGRNYLPEAEAVVDVTRDMLQAFVDLDPEQQKGIANFLSITTATAGFTGGLILLLPKIAAAKAAMIALNITMLGPVGLVAGGLAAVYAITQLPVPLENATIAVETLTEASKLLEPELYAIAEAEQEAARAAEEELLVAANNLADGWMSNYSPALIQAREQTTGWEVNLLNVKQPIVDVHTETWELTNASLAAAAEVGNLAISTSTFAGSLGELDFKNEAIWEMALAAGAGNEQMLNLAVATGVVTQREADLTLQGWALTEMWVQGKLPLDSYLTKMADLERQMERATSDTGRFVDVLNRIQPTYATNVHTTYTESGTRPWLPEGPGYQHGTPYVPQTGWAFLHEGEAVLTKEENRRGGQGGSSQVIIHNHFGRDSVRSDEDIRYIINTLDNQQRALELQGMRSRIS